MEIILSGNIKHKTSIGGQALIEGIMMRGPKGNAVSVRMPDGTIDTELEQYTPLKTKYKILGVPVIRGVAAFIESMATGYKYLMKSADKAMTEEEKEEDMSKFDRWLNDRLGEKMMAVVGAISAVLGVAVAFLIFMYLPTLLVDKFDEFVVRGADIAKFHPLLEAL